MIAVAIADPALLQGAKENGERLAQLADPRTLGLDRWNAARIDEEIGQIAAWGKRRNVPLTCNEFGVYRKSAQPKDRAAWISDVRTTLEKYGIGWTMWDYSGGFALVVKQEGRAVPDELTVKALGRAMPQVQPQR